jgi:histidinol-phosphate/aromatic aminotransferase/cobyric acid decarboxylase-like protein
VSQDYARPNGGIVFPNPNAPTGCLLALDAIEQLLQINSETVVVVDEAYVDFGGESAISLIDRYPNLLVTQTLSKSRSLAGLRVGIAVGHVDLIEALERIKNSFNSYPLDRLAIAGAAAAFEDREYFEQTCRQVISDRTLVEQGLHRLGFEVLPSAANFVLARHPQHCDAALLAVGLRQHGVIVRHFNSRALPGSCVSVLARRSRTRRCLKHCMNCCRSTEAIFLRWQGSGVSRLQRSTARAGLCGEFDAEYFARFLPGDLIHRAQAVARRFAADAEDHITRLQAGVHAPGLPR